MKKKAKKILYKEYLAKHKEDAAEEKMKEKFQTDAVVINKVTTGAKIIQTLADAAWKILKILAAVIVFGLLSLAVTVLVNEPLREFVIEYFSR